MNKAKLLDLRKKDIDEIVNQNLKILPRIRSLVNNLERLIQ